MSTSNKSATNRVTMLGAGAVGKSAITIRMVANEWRQEYDPTIEDSYTCMIDLDGAPQRLDILDTAGQEQFAALQDHWIREADSFILIYSVNSLRTFKHLEDVYKKIQRNHDDDAVVLILVANKCDLPINQHEATKEMGQQLASSWGVPFVATSAKTGENVRYAFETLARAYNRKQNATVNTALLNETNKSKSGCSCVLL